MAATIKCPTCKQITVYHESNPTRPFCSQCCQLIDLGAWATDAFVVEGSAPSTVEEAELLDNALHKHHNL